MAEMSLLEFMESKGGVLPELDESSNKIPSVADRSFDKPAGPVPSFGPGLTGDFVPGVTDPKAFPKSISDVSTPSSPADLVQAQRQTGGPLDLQLQLGLASRSEKRQRRILDEFSAKKYPKGFVGWKIGSRGQKQIWQEHPVHGPMWIDLNEEGLSFGDFAEHASVGVETLAQTLVMMTIAGLPGAAAFGLSPTALKTAGFKKIAQEAAKFGAAMTAIGQTAGLGASALGAGTGFEEGELGEELGRRTEEGSLEFVLGGAADMAGLAARVLKDEGKKKAMKFAAEELMKKRDFNEFTSEMAKAKWRAAQHLSRITNGRVDPNVILTAGQELNIPFLRSAEALTAKIPGTAQRNLKEVQQQQMRTVEDYFTRDRGDAGKISEELLGVFEVIDNEMFETAEKLRKIAISKGTDEAIIDIAGRMAPRPGHKLFMTDLGRGMRDAAEGIRRKFREDQRVGWDLVRSMPGGRDHIVPRKAVSTEIAKLEKEMGEALDAQLKSFISRFRSEGEGNMTIDQARIWRNELRDIFTTRSSLPNVDDFGTKRLWESFNKAIDGATAGGKHPALRKALLDQNRSYKKGVRPMWEDGVKDFFSKNGRGNFYVDNDTLAKRIIERPDELANIKAFLGPDSEAWNRYRRGIWDWGLRNNRAEFDPKGKFINSVKQARWFESLDEKSRQILFGGETQEIRRVLKLISAGRGHIDLRDVSRLTGSVAETLRESARIMQRRERLFQNNVLKPFLKGSVGADAIDSEEFLLHMMSKGNPKDIRAVMNKLESDRPSIFFKIRRKAMSALIESSSSNKTAADMTISMKGGSQGTRIDGAKLWTNLVDKYGVDEATAARRLSAIIGDQNYKGLKAAAIISATQKGQEEGFELAFGLMGGTIQANLFRGMSRVGTTKKARRQLFSALSDMAVFRIIGTILTDPSARKILREGAQASPQDVLDMLSVKALRAADKTQRKLPASTSALVKAAVGAKRAVAPAARGVGQAVAFPFTARPSRAVAFRALFNEQPIMDALIDEFKEDPDMQKQVQVFLNDIRHAEDGISLEEFIEGAQEVRDAGDL